MKDKNEQIDLLLERNTTEQLETVDWDGLNAAILNQLDRAEMQKSSTRKYRSVFKIAAGVAAVAAVVFVAVMIKTEAPTDVQLEEGRKAVVKFIESKGTASVEIIDLNGDLKKESDEPTWIIISRPEPVYADNGISRDVMSMICLF